MIDTEQTAYSINLFETARRVLGHAATLNMNDIDRMFAINRGYGHGNVRTGLIRYALALAEAREIMHDKNTPDPVIPSVDVANLRISHVTCTGRTGFGIQDGYLSGTRSEPFDAKSPRDIALWLVIPQWSLQSDQLFEQSNIFGQAKDGKNVPGASRYRNNKDQLMVGAEAGYVKGNDGSILSSIRVLEAIAILVDHGVTLQDACVMVDLRGIKVDPDKVLMEMESRRVGLWLLDRPWVQDACRTMSNAKIPDDVRALKTAMLDAADDGRRSRHPASVLHSSTPKAPVSEELADWERELL